MTKYSKIILELERKDVSVVEYDKIADIEFFDNAVLITEQAVETSESTERDFYYIPNHMIRSMTWHESNDC